jgi:predicted  nucleic acid-binding Zn-ribbon protein
MSERAVEELLRVNAELAAELRALSEGRAARPRSGPNTAARSLARLEAEHAALAERLEATERELGQTQAHREGLERQNQEMATEIARLSAGLPGYLRKLRGRLTGR